jgi:hypothetical protein
MTDVSKGVAELVAKFGVSWANNLLWNQSEISLQKIEKSYDIFKDNYLKLSFKIAVSVQN